MTIARSIHALLIATTFLLAACTSVPKFEKSENLGYGFQLVQARVASSAFEGVGHYSYVYQAEKKICRCTRTEFFISPQGKYAIFLDEEVGRIELLDVGSGRVAAIGDGYLATPEAVIWNGEETEAVIRFFQNIPGQGNREPLTVKLNEFA